MDPGDLRSFARRDWNAIDHARREYWAERFRREGAGPSRQAASALYHHARRLGAFSNRDRAEDLTDHLSLRDRLDRAGRALTGR